MAYFPHAGVSQWSSMTVLRRIPSSVESVVASSLPHLAASSLTPANQGTSDHRHFKRHLRVMDIDEINPEIHANARPEELDQPGLADASQSTSSPSRAGAQRPRNEDNSPADAPPKAYSRLSDDEILDYESSGSAGAAGASASQDALRGRPRPRPCTSRLQRASAPAHPPDGMDARSVFRATLGEGALSGPAGAPGAAGAAPS